MGDEMGGIGLREETDTSGRQQLQPPILAVRTLAHTRAHAHSLIHSVRLVFAIFVAETLRNKTRNHKLVWFFFASEWK